MNTRYLMAAVAAPALLIGAPAFAQENSNFSPRFSVSYSNELETSLNAESSFESEVSIDGDVLVEGTIHPDSSASAINDTKQMLTDLAVEDSGTNLVNRFDVTGNGNVGVNVAAGFLNDQLNSTTIAVSADNRTRAARFGGMSSAHTSSFQYLANLDYENSAPPPEGNELSNGTSATNTINFGTISGSGNLGVNAAAGAFNQQSNLLTLAVATDSVLSQANAGLVQSASLSEVGDQDGPNTVNSGAISGTGNIGVNLAAGVGNQQLNSLTIASSSAGSAPVAPPPGGGTTGS